MLQPKRTKFRKQHKGRNRGLALVGSKVSFGEFGLRAEGRGRLTARQIEAARRAITRHVKRGAKLWIRVFPDKPITKKPLEVRQGHCVGIDDPQPSDARGGKVERGGGAQPSGADEHDLRCEQPTLACLAHLGDREVSRVASSLRGVESAERRCDGGKSLVEPGSESALERPDVGEAEPAQALCGEQRTGPARAEEHDGPVGLGRELFDPELEERASHVHGSLGDTCSQLVSFPDVQEQCAVPCEPVGFLGPNLADRVPQFGEALLLPAHGRHDTRRPRTS